MADRDDPESESRTELPAEAPAESPGEAPAEPAEASPEQPTAPKKPRRIGWIITVILLAVALIATGAVLAVSLIRLSEARQEIDRQGDLIEEKETFGAAASELMTTAKQLDGVPYAALVNTNLFESLIARGWDHRWNSEELQRDTLAVGQANDQLARIIAAAEAEAATNGTGTTFESLTDQLGGGYVKTSLDTADSECEEDVWGCVAGDDPFTIHYDASETNGEPFMSDWLRTGLAYHEYAHVLQMTNPVPTKTAEEAFGGDWETMADCYALTYLPGWTLDHTIPISAYEWWEVSVGYGYTCDEAQRQVIRDWVAALGYTHEPISQ
ncbi:hypothetical protein BH10ACT7_BH10ACT7_00270 [soil metagenome]